MINLQLLDQKWVTVPTTIIYRFFNYNRHAMVGGADHDWQQIWIPTNQKIYRWIYILLTAVITGFIVNHFALLLDSKLGLSHAKWREFAVCFGQILWQFGALTFIAPSKRLGYLGNMSTVSLIGGLLLIPLFVCDSIWNLSWIIFGTCFAVVVGIMFLLHLNRCKRLYLPFITSISWVIYRSFVLLIIVLVAL